MGIMLAQLLSRRKELNQRVTQYKPVSVHAIIHRVQERALSKDGVEEILKKVPKNQIHAVTAHFDYYSRQLIIVDEAIQFTNSTTKLEPSAEIFDEFNLDKTDKKTLKVSLGGLLLRRKYLNDKVGQLDVLLAPSEKQKFETVVQRKMVHEGLDDVTVQATTVSRNEIQQARNFYAKRQRMADDIIQHTNWNTEIDIKADVLKDLEEVSTST